MYQMIKFVLTIWSRKNMNINDLHKSAFRSLCHIYITVNPCVHIYIYTLYLTTLAPTTTKVDLHGGRPYKN